MRTCSPSSTLSRGVTQAWLMAIVLVMTACAHGPVAPPSAGDDQPDKFLFDRGSEMLTRRRWFEAREYFSRLVETFPHSQYRQDAKLGIGDSYIGEDRVDSYVLAASEFREFLTFFPLNERADYAQYKLAIAE